MRFLTLKSFFYSLATKRDGEYNSLSYDSKKAGFNNSGGGPKSTRRREHRNTLKCRLSTQMKNSPEISQTINFLTVISACHERVSNPSEHP